MIRDAQKRETMTEFRSEYRGQPMYGLDKGRGYAMQLEQVQIGEPITAHVYIDEVGNGHWLTLRYDDINAYGKCWRKITQKSIKKPLQLVTDMVT